MHVMVEGGSGEFCGSFELVADRLIPRRRRLPCRRHPVQEVAVASADFAPCHNQNMFRVPRDILIGFLLVCAAGWFLMETRALRFADRRFYDAQIGWLRARSPTPLAQDVVVIGIDEAAFVAIPEPTALWHAHLGTCSPACRPPNRRWSAWPCPCRSAPTISWSRTSMPP
jgi:hypothetical protein